MKIENEKISIVIPVYNAERFLAACIESVLGQTYKNIEIICVNDASEDESSIILEQYAVKDNRVLILDEKYNVGTSKARKDGVLITTGNYILFLDADDRLDREACARLKKIMEIHSADILQFGIKVESCNGIGSKKTESVQKYVEPLMGEHTIKEVREKCFQKMILSHNLCGKVFKGDLCREAFSYLSDERYIMAEDLYAYFAITELASTYYGIGDVFYYYRYGYGITGKGRDIVSRLEAYCSQADVVKACGKLVEKTKRSEDDIVAGIEKNMIQSTLRFIEENIDDLNIVQEEVLNGVFYKHWDYALTVKMIIDSAEKSRSQNRIIGEKKWAFPYKDIPAESKIILYGAGDVGKDYYDAVTDSGYCEIVAWADRVYERCCVGKQEIINPSSIMEYEFDQILIAVHSEELKYEIKKTLMNFGVPEEKVI